MSASPLSSKANTFSPNQARYFTRQNSNSPSPMNFNIHSSSPSSTTRIYGPKPFYRSGVTPEPFDYTNQHRQENDYRSQRRYSVNQINVNDNADNDDNNRDSFSSDESLSIEFPPPPNEFSSSPPTQDKNSFIQTMIIHSDSGSSLSNSYFSDHEQTSPKQFQYPHIRPTTPTTNNNSSRPAFSVISSRASPNRSEIRFSPSSPTPTKLHISRPDSPSIVINNRPLPFTNGNDTAFHISLGPTTHSNQLGRSSPSIRPIDDRFRFYGNPNGTQSPHFDSPCVVNLPPTHLGNLIKKDSADVDFLTKTLLKNFHSSNQTHRFNRCARCHDEILGEENGLEAMNQMYHVSCFTCTMCGCRLRGTHFYSMENQPYCEACYIKSLEKCVACARPITDRILRATGKPYHAECFCCVLCHKSLDGVPFTIDARMDVHCIDCFHQKFAPRCYVCHRSILPANGQAETIRIVALDRNYHIDCYRCENCHIQFTLDQGCYPIDEHLFCLQCNRLYSKQIFGHT